MGSAPTLKEALTTPGTKVSGLSGTVADVYQALSFTPPPSTPFLLTLVAENVELSVESVTTSLVAGSPTGTIVLAYSPSGGVSPPDGVFPSGWTVSLTTIWLMLRFDKDGVFPEAVGGQATFDKYKFTFSFNADKSVSLALLDDAAKGGADDFLNALKPGGTPAKLTFASLFPKVTAPTLSSARLYWSPKAEMLSLSIGINEPWNFPSGSDFKADVTSVSLGLTLDLSGTPSVSEIAVSGVFSLAPNPNPQNLEFLLDVSGSHDSSGWSLGASMWIASGGGKAPPTLPSLLNAFGASTVSLPTLLNEVALEFVTADLTSGGYSLSCGFAISAKAPAAEPSATLSLSHSPGTYKASLRIDDFDVPVTELVTQLAPGILAPPPAAVAPPSELTVQSATLQYAKSAWSVGCQGLMLFGTDGASLAFDLELDQATKSDPATFTLTLGGLHFSCSKVPADGTTPALTLFTFAGSDTITLSDLARLLRVQALEQPSFDPSLTVKAAFVALQDKTTTAPAKKLFGLLFDVSDSLPSNGILELVTAGSTVELQDATLLAASAPWSTKELQNLVANGVASSFQLDKELPHGPSFSATLQVGDSTVRAPLAPTGQAPATSGHMSTPPAPRPVTSSTATHWFDVQRQIGPVYLGRAAFALGHTDGGSHKVDLQLDGSFVLGPLTIGLDDFAIEFPIEKGFTASDIDVTLHGMDLAYSKPPLTMSGGFVHTDANGQDRYIGEVAIATDSLSLSAVGEYAKVKGTGGAPSYTSLALFASLNDPPLGGPAFCFVTGLAAGFGYNSKLAIPTRASQVADFALVQYASGAPPSGDPLTTFSQVVQPSSGDDWFAIGLDFTSFELLQSTALLTVAFGHDLQFALLAQSEMSIPPNSPERLAYAQVDVLATLSPATGALQVFGALSRNSFVLSPDCHLSGGFAYILKSSGDFVVTFGGYHPNYDFAKFGYPAVPRLEMLWQVDDNTCIKGTEYFALTPSAMMAGGSLAATFHSGSISAWFTVDVDMFLQWKPFHYECDFAMALGVSFELHLAFVHVHMTVHVGASLRVAGPPFHGTAHIDLDVISFSVRFGPSPKAAQPLLYADFRKLLPGSPTHDATASKVLSVKVTGGLIRDLSQSKPTPPEPIWIVNCTQLRLEVRTSVPFTTLLVSGLPKLPANVEPASFGILPLQLDSATSQLSLTLTGSNGDVPTAATENLALEAISVDAPPALWGTTAPPPLNGGPIQAVGGCIISAGPPCTTGPIEVLLSHAPTTVTCRSDRTAAASPFAAA